MNVPSRFDVATRRIKCTARRHRQLKGIDEQFSLNLLRKPGARIDYNLACDRISGVLFKFSHTRGHRRQLLRWNARQFPCHLRRVDLEKCKAQILAGARKHLR